MVIEGAYDRVLRVLAVSVGIGSVIFTLLGFPSMIAQQQMLNPVFSLAAYILYCGLPPIIAIVAFRVSIRVIRTLAGVHAVSALLFLALWYPSMSPEFLPADLVPWLTNLIAVATCTAALAVPFLPAWVYLFVIAAGGGILRFALSGGTNASEAFQDSILLALFSIVMVSLIQLTLRSGREQDAAAAVALTEAAANGAAERIERQRSRYQEYTLDDVIATLHSASRDFPGSPADNQSNAVRVLQKMDDLRRENLTETAITAADFEGMLRTAAQGAMAVGISVAEASDAPILIPRDVADGLTEALGEAVRNSLRHANWKDETPVLRRARVIINPAGVDIAINDDGRGFNVKRIALDRMGVRVNILQRVNSLPGGRAVVTSSKRNGATVSLSWRRNGVPA